MADVNLTRAQTAARILAIGDPANLPATDADIVAAINRLSLAPDATDYALAAFATDTASGSVASFTDGADDIPVKALTVDIEPVQSGSGTPSPSNVRPISGHTGCTISVGAVQGTADETHAVDWTDEAGTVYKGTLNATTGELTVDRQYITLGSTLSPAINGRSAVYAASGITPQSGHLYYTELGWTTAGYLQYSADFSRASEMISDQLSYVSVGSLAQMNEGEMTAWQSTSIDTDGDRLVQIYFSHSAATVADLKIALEVDPIHVLYPLKTPRTYQIDTVTVKSLIGNNNIWADTGDVAVTYRADTALYVAKKIAEAMA